MGAAVGEIAERGIGSCLLVWRLRFPGFRIPRVAWTGIEKGEVRLRSLLFVPGDSQRKFARAKDCGADALILDLEDSVAGSEKAAARAHVADLIEKEPKRPWTFIVRINALDTGLALDDVA